MYRPKDFIETAEGLVFAVLSNVLEDNRIVCFLRYVDDQGHWRKVSTHAANHLLATKYPQLQLHSVKLDADIHAVPIDLIVKHYQPPLKLTELSSKKPEDIVEQDVQQLCQLLVGNGLILSDIGITGSLLLGAQNPASDIDLVFYDRDVFHQARDIGAKLIKQGDCQALSEQAWRQSYQRRDCALTLPEYIWHERRKKNKLLINQRKVDLSLIVDDFSPASGTVSKSGKITLRSRVKDDFYGFDYPAIFLLEDQDIESVVCFTATYSGQVKTGEMIEVAGQLEVSAEGIKRIIVGSSREAPGEYIKVI